MAKANAEPLVTIHKNAREDVRICLSEYQGRQRLDVRQWADYSAGGVDVRGPTKQGVNLSVDQLPDLIEGLMVARDKAVELGLLPGEAA